MTAAAPPSPPTLPPTLMVCLQCGSTGRDVHGCKLPNPAASTLAHQVHQRFADDPATHGMQVQLVRCFNQCSNAIAWAVRAEDRFSYVFAPALTPESMVAFTKAWLRGEPHGRVAWSDIPADEPCNLRATFRVRIPPALPREDPATLILPPHSVKPAE